MSPPHRVGAEAPGLVAPVATDKCKDPGGCDAEAFLGYIESSETRFSFAPAVRVKEIPASRLPERLALFVGCPLANLPGAVRARLAAVRRRNLEREALYELVMAEVISRGAQYDLRAVLSGVP